MLGGNRENLRVLFYGTEEGQYQKDGKKETDWKNDLKYRRVNRTWLWAGIKDKGASKLIPGFLV